MRDSATLFPSHCLQPKALTVQGKTRWHGTRRRRRKLRDCASVCSSVLVCDREEDTRGIWEAQVVTPKAESSSGALFDTSAHRLALCFATRFRLVAFVPSKEETSRPPRPRPQPTLPGSASLWHCEPKKTIPGSENQS